MNNIEDWKGYTTICRLCLHRDGFMMGIFNHIQGKEKSIYKKIIDCTALEISYGDGLPNCICHRCLYKIEFCLEFRQQCFMSDATLRQISGISTKQFENVNSQINNFSSTLGQQDEPENDVVMVVDPTALDYDSEYESENNEHVSDNENSELNELYRNVFMCKFCDQAFTEKMECLSHELSAHNNKVPYTCSLCDMGFGDRLQYSAHLKSIHQNDKPYNCPECDRTFARRSDLRKHTVVHTGIKPFTCTVCFKSFSRNTNLSKHMRIHSGQKPFVCPKCPKTFISKGDLTRHTVIHTGQKPFGCNYCHLNFGRRDKLIRHEKRHFPQPNSQDKSHKLQLMRESLAEFGFKTENHNNNEENTQIKDEWSNSENMIINLDPFNHNSYSNVDLHSQIDIKSENGTPNGENDLPRVPDHISEDILENDLIENQRELPYIPEHITGDSFTSPTNDEKDRPMENIKRYSCQICPKKFSNVEGLRIHMSMHSGDRPHPCNICSKSFLRKRELDRHIATHTGMKPFKCTSCDKRFGRKDKLVRHMRIHEVNRDHICVICSASFNRKDALTQHLKTHTTEEVEPETCLV